MIIISLINNHGGELWKKMITVDLVIIKKVNKIITNKIQAKDKCGDAGVKRKQDPNLCAAAQS